MPYQVRSSPPRSGIELEKFQSPCVIPQLIEGKRAGAELKISRIQRKGSVALVRRFLHRASVTRYVCQSKMRLSILRMPLYQSLGVGVGFCQFSSFHSIGNQPGRRKNEVRIENHGAFESGIGLLK